MENINNCHVFPKRICLVIRRNCEYVRICSKFRHSSVYLEYNLFEIISNKFYNLILCCFNRYFSSFVTYFSTVLHFSYSKSIQIKMKYYINTEMEKNFLNSISSSLCFYFFKQFGTLEFI